MFSFFDLTAPFFARFATQPCNLPIATSRASTKHGQHMKITMSQSGDVLFQPLLCETFMVCGFHERSRE